MTGFSSLLDRAVALAETEIGNPQNGILPDEETFVSGAVEKRRLEFAAGRTCARRALHALGLPPQPILARPDRTPVWPPGVVGSITHSGTKAAAAAALRSDGIRAIGIDLEPAGPLPEDLWPEILTPAERAQLARMPGIATGLTARAVFCAKEAVYKAVYPLTGRVLEFSQVDIALQPDRSGFEARLHEPHTASRVASAIAGRLSIGTEFIAAAVVLR